MRLHVTFRVLLVPGGVAVGALVGYAFKLDLWAGAAAVVLAAALTLALRRLDRHLIELGKRRERPG